jgi:hypothetical protein
MVAAHRLQSRSPMKTVIWSLVLVSTAVGVSTARAEAPAWCKTAGIEKGRFDDDHVSTALETDNATRNTHAIVRETCFPDDEGKQRAKEIAKARDAWSAKLGFGDAEWVDLAIAGSADPRGNSASDVSGMRLAYDKKYAWSGLDPVDQFAGELNGFSDDGYANVQPRYTYYADALGAKLSEAGRLAYIMNCLSGNSAKEVEWAMCAPDITRFDKKKVLAELRTSIASPTFKTILRFTVYDIDAKLASHAKDVKALIAKDAVYGKMFEIAEATRKQWDSIWTTDAAVLDLALQMEDARSTQSRKAFEGCEDKTRAAWEAEVAKLSASTFEGISTEDQGVTYFPTPVMAALLTTPGGYNASVALFLCAVKGSKDDRAKNPIIDTVGNVLQFYPGQRGPRTAALLAIRSAGLVLDDASAHINYPNADRSSFFRGLSARGNFAAIAKVEPKGTAPEGITGPVVTVTYAKKTDKQEECTSSKTLNRIAYIRGDGTVAYQTYCLKWEMVTIDNTPDPQVVSAHSAKGLTAGMKAYVTNGEVVAVWPKGSKAPTILVGIPLKK